MQTDRRSAFVVDCVKICLTSSSIVMQNSVVVSRTVCAHVGSTNNLGMLGPHPSARMVVGLSQFPARRRGTHCQHTFIMWRTAPLHLDDYLRLICFLSTSVYSALGVSAIMRYINRRFTYLFTPSNNKGIADALETCYSPTLYHMLYHTKFHSSHLGVSRGSQKIERRWGPVPLGCDMADPLDIHFSPTVLQCQIWSF